MNILKKLMMTKSGKSKDCCSIIIEEAAPSKEDTPCCGTLEKNKCC
ncbi:hypothetical protein ACQUWN_13805 [Rossellomorea aquimaris]|nr:MULTISPECIES: hypothetical protein [Bacillaceae]